MHESSYESVSGFSSKVIGLGLGLGFGYGVVVALVLGLELGLGLPMFFSQVKHFDS